MKEAVICTLEENIQKVHKKDLLIDKLQHEYELLENDCNNFCLPNV